MPRANAADARSPGRRARVVALATASLLSVAMIEAALRLTDQPRFDACAADETSPWQADPEVFRRLRPDVQIGVGRTNALGLRGPVLDERRSAGASRLLFLGDSTCWGLGVVLDETFAFASARLAANELGHAVEAVNGCVPGHSSFQTLGMQRRLMRFSPDVVVLYVGARNDVDRHLYFPDSAIPDRIARRSSSWHRIHVLRGLEATWDGLYKKLLRKPRSLAGRARVSPAAFRDNLTALITIAHEGGARTLVVAPPYSAPHLARYPLIPEYQQAIREVAGARDAAYVELQPAFASRLEREVYHEDGYHFSAEGHAIASDLIAREIAKLLDLRDAPSAATEPDRRHQPRPQTDT